jgi:hypothetical protein
MLIMRTFAGIAVGVLTVGLAWTPATAAQLKPGTVKQFDRPAIQTQLKKMLTAKKARLVAARVKLSTEMRVQMCQKQSDNLGNALYQCVTTNSDPVNPPPQSPLDAFNKLTNAQLAQKCPGSLQQCLDQVLEEQVAWCKATVCKSQADALDAKKAECAQLEQLLAQELSQPPQLKKNTPPCPDLYQAYLKAREAVKNFQCGGGWSGLGCIAPLVKLLDEEKAALQKLTDNGCI